jgi:hypothetical protein
VWPPGVCVAGSFAFGDADYAQNVQEDGEANEWQQSLWVLTQVCAWGPVLTQVCAGVLGCVRFRAHTGVCMGAGVCAAAPDEG